MESREIISTNAIALESHKPTSLRRARRRISLTRIPAAVWVILDFLICAGAVFVAMRMHTLRLNKVTRFGESDILKMALISGTGYILAAVALDLYAQGMYRSWLRLLPATFGCALIATIAPVGIGYFLFFDIPGRIPILAMFGIIFGAATAIRGPLLLFRRYFRKRILYLGDEEHVAKAKVLIKGAGPYGPELFGIQSCISNENDELSLSDICMRLKIDEIVLSPSREGVDGWFPQAVNTVRIGCRLTTLPDLLENETREVPLDMIDATWLLGTGWDLRNHLTELTKRAIDIVVGIVGLVCTVPVYLVLAPIIKLTSPGPVLYSQWRVGRFGLSFRIWKFRTMGMDAEQDGPQWASQADDRVTLVGKFLRKTRFDEIPQFWNILWGQMSLVGPRPERPEFVADLEKQISFYNCRHLLRPGLTGWAQINYRYGASIEDAKRKLQFELYYVRHHSIALDLAIILRTMVVIFRGSR